MKKRTILFLLIAFALILFASCTNDTPDTPAGAGNNAGSTPPGELNMQDWYFFRHYSGGRFGTLGDKSPVKINPVTQTVSFVCMDPLCDHGSDCPLFGPVEIYASGNYLFFNRIHTFYDSDAEYGTRVVRNLYAYDMISGNARKLLEGHELMHMLGGTRNFLYYRAYLPNEDDEDDEFPAYYVIYRANAVSGSIIEISEPFTSILTQSSIFAVIDDRIYWLRSEGSLMLVYATDLDGGNKETVHSIGGYTAEEREFMDDESLIRIGVIMNAFNFGIYNNDHIYYPYISDSRNAEWRDRAIRDNKLYKIPFDLNGEPEFIAESVIHFIPHGDKIYFTTLAENPELIEHNGEQTYNWSGGKVWVMNSDGTDRRLLAETGYNLSDRFSRGFCYFTEAKTINGVDYIAWSILVANEDERVRGINFRTSPNTIIINASTGEWVVLSPPE
jgi:hypothetical protein